MPYHIDQSAPRLFATYLVYHALGKSRSLMKMVSKPCIFTTHARHRRATAATVVFLLLLTAHQLLLTSSSVKAASPDISDSASSTYLVALDSTLTEGERTELLERFDAELIRWIPELHLAEVRIAAISAGDNQGTVQAARNLTDTGSTDTGFTNTVRAAAAFRATRIASLSAHPSVEFIEENAVVQGTFSADDPELQDSTNGYAQQLLHMEAAWNHTMGNADVIIAILDTGIDGNHPEFSGQLVPGYDFINGTDNATDDNGHGTHVAGIAGARINNNRGSAGICPNCKLMPVKVLDENNVGVWSVIVQGIIFAVDNGAQIINLSLGSADESTAVRRAVQYAQENGALLVAAAGNSRSNKLFYPAAYSGVISVAATDNEDQEWSLSNYGTYIDVAAPGYLIFSTSISNEEYSYMTGTSMATPFVTGLAGLLLSQAPNSTATELTDRIIQNTVDLGVPGWDSTFGFGRIDASAALASLNSASQPLAPVRSPEQRATVIFMPVITQ